MPFILQANFIPGYIAEQMAPEPNQALISINEPGAKEYELSPDWGHLLKLRFLDTDLEHPEAFTKEHAEQIIDWIFSLPEEVDTIIVHCYAGLSRSAAVVMFISEIFKLGFPEKYMIYNRRVYSTLMGVWHTQQEELLKIAEEILAEAL